MPIQIEYYINGIVLRFNGRSVQKEQNKRKKKKEKKMNNLTAEMHNSLNPYVIGLLNKNNVHTIEKFLCTDPIKLMSITNIGMQTNNNYSHWAELIVLIE